MKRFRSACLALASACLGAIAADAARPQYGGTLRVQTEMAIRTIDPAAVAPAENEAPTKARLEAQLYEPLVAVEEGGLRPRLAVWWEQERSGARWTFRLRAGVTRHDGAPLEAWQVAASLRSVEPRWKVTGEADVIAIEPDLPSTDVPWRLADERHSIAIRGAGSAPVGTGPFRLDRIDGARILLRAHDAYWAGRPFADVVQVDTARRSDAQLADLEAGRADIVEVRPIDARRAARRGSRVESSKPLELVALVFEPHRVSDATLAWRRTLASTLNRDAICSVVLQGHATPASSLLPPWLSGYSVIVAPPAGPTLTRSAVAALPLDMRELALRVDAGDAVAQAIAERIAVDARGAGLTINVQTPTGLAPRPDVRLVRVRLAAAAPERAFAAAATRLTTRGWPVIASPDTAALEATYRAEQALVDRVVVVPVVHLPELYALGERVGPSAGPIVNPMGGWSLADAWVRSKP
jgi:ABC-type transport system substrate-binding protein